MLGFTTTKQPRQKKKPVEPVIYVLIYAKYVYMLPADLILYKDYIYISVKFISFRMKGFQKSVLYRQKDIQTK